MDKLNSLGISVIICSYNGAHRLPQTLKHLALQVVSAEIPWEIILIDNTSTDDTFRVAGTEWQQYNLPDVSFRILSEHRQSKYHALSTGVDHAIYEYIIICDDDNWLNNDYVSLAYHTINANTDFAAIGGQGIAVADIDIPDWFWQYQNGYAVGSPKITSGDISAKGYLWGAGMVFRRSLYRKVNRDLPGILLGPDQKDGGRAEDVELCMRFLLAGYRLYYNAALVFRHYIQPNRLTDKFRDNFLNISKYEDRILNLYRKQLTINTMKVHRRYLLFCASILRYCICKIFPGIRRWHDLHEAEVIYLLNGLKMTRVSEEVIKIRQLNLQLSSKIVD